MHLLRPKAWKSARRVRNALIDYPLFAPPHREHPTFLDFHAAKENERYFFEHRSERIDALRSFLRAFEIELALEGAGLAAVSAWFSDYAGLLTPMLRDRLIRQAFYRLMRPWTGRLRGLNALFDLGLFFGECVIARNPRCFWQGFVGSTPGTPTRPVREIEGTGIGIQGSRRKPYFDPFLLVEMTCSNLQGRHYMFRTPSPSGAADAGYLSNLIEIYGEPKR